MEARVTVPPISPASLPAKWVSLYPKSCTTVGKALGTIRLSCASQPGLRSKLWARSAAPQKVAERQAAATTRAMSFMRAPAPETPQAAYNSPSVMDDRLERLLDKAKSLPKAP